MDRCGLWMFVLLSVPLWGCSNAPATGPRVTADAGSKGKPKETPAIEQVVVNSYVCEETPMQSCYCPNGGELQGSQTCTANGQGGSTLGPCSGCPTSEDGPAGSALCPELQAQAGCMATTFRSEELPASVLFLLDRSGSMLCNAPPFQASSACGVEPLDASMPSKWDITVAALEQTFADLTGGNVNAALSFFSVDGQCAAETTPAVALQALDSSQAAALGTALKAETPEGRTPIVSALINAYQYMHWEARPGCAVQPCGAPGNRFVVLLTDGAESCANSDEQMRLLTETVADALSVNIRTFVIGAPGSELARGFLSELAFQGGTARSADCKHGDSDGDCHFDMTSTTDFAADLQSVLGDIGGSVGCSFAVSGAGTVNVQYALSGDSDPSCLVHDESMPCDQGAEGWQYAKNPDGSDDTSQVIICGSACADIRNDSGAQVDIVLNCQELEVLQ